MKKALIIDDERLARSELKKLLADHPEIVVVGEAVNAKDGLEKIETLHPDLLFLDIQMPDKTGFDLLAELEKAPQVIFTTAYDEHALKAFEYNALDYLLKPFSDERFEATMARVKARLDERSMKEFGQRVMKMVNAAPSAPEKRLDRLVVKAGGTTRFIRVIDIDWIEAAGVYVTLHVGGKELLYRAALNDLAEKLDPRRFVRVHRSALINIESVVQLEPISHGEFEAVLKNGSRTRVSRTYRGQLEKRLGQPL